VNRKTINADERLRAANAAATERDHLVRLQSSLVGEVAREQQRVQQLAAELRREQQDVERLTKGVSGFLGQLLSPETLSREQHEAFEAEARLREAVASRDQLRTQAVSVDSRLAALVPAAIAAELRAARADKETALRDEGGEAAANLQEFAVQLSSIDIELIPLEDAVASGDAALAVLAELAAAIDRARADAKLDKREAQENRGLAGEAQARLTVFHRALGELAAPGDLFVPPSDVTPDDAFADGWIKALFGRGDAAARMAAARASIVERLERIHARLIPVRARHDELAARRAALAAERERIVVG
jgi:hypothetical protein